MTGFTTPSSGATVSGDHTVPDVAVVISANGVTHDGVPMTPTSRAGPVVTNATLLAAEAAGSRAAASAVDADGHKLLKTSSVSLLGAVMLFCAFMGTSSLGVATDLVESVTPMCHAVWRSQGLLAIAIIVILAQRALGRKVTPKPVTTVQTTRRDALVFALKVIGYFVGYTTWMYTFFIALDYASELDVYLFNQGHAMIVLFFRVLTCRKLPRSQYVAMVIVCTGLYFALSGNSHLLGIGIALGGGVAGLAFVHLSATVQSKMTLFEACAAMQVCNIIVGVALAMAMNSPSHIHLSLADPFNVHYGFFGWIHLSMNSIMALMYTILVCGLVGMLGYTWAAANMPPLMVQAVMLLEPGMASVMAIVMNQGSMPSTDAWIGFGTITVGCLIVIATEARGSSVVVVTKTETLDKAPIVDYAKLTDKQYMALASTPPGIRHADSVSLSGLDEPRQSNASSIFMANSQSSLLAAAAPAGVTSPRASADIHIV